MGFPGGTRGKESTCQCRRCKRHGFDLLIGKMLCRREWKHSSSLAWKIPWTEEPGRLQLSSVQFSRSVMSNSAAPWTAARQASLSITNSQSLLKLISIELVMPSDHLILCHPLILLPSIFPSIRVFPNESVLHLRWPKYWSFSFSISPSDEYSGLISFGIDWLDPLAV